MTRSELFPLQGESGGHGLGFGVRQTPWPYPPHRGMPRGFNKNTCTALGKVPGAEPGPSRDERMRWGPHTLGHDQGPPCTDPAHLSHLLSHHSRFCPEAYSRSSMKD